MPPSDTELARDLETIAAAHPHDLNDDERSSLLQAAASLRDIGYDDPLPDDDDDTTTGTESP